MNPVSIDTDYLILRIGRLTINLEAYMAQYNSALQEIKLRDGRIEELESELATKDERILELEEIIASIADDDDEESDEDLNPQLAARL